MAFPPTAFLIGAQKAGTTYLAGLLDRQPGIAVARPKEPHFFTQHWERGIEWYQQCFPRGDDERMFLDASPSYAAAPLHLEDAGGTDQSRSRLAGVPDRIRETSPHARFIYVLREPVDRIWSSYWHDVRNNGEKHSLAMALERDHRYRNMSNYLGQIHHYLRCFPLERFLFLRFEDLRSDPVTAVERCLDFLEIDERIPVVPAEAGRHSGYRPGRIGRFVNRVGKAAPMIRRTQERLWARLPAGVRDSLRRHLTRSIPSMDAELRARLQAEYRPMLGDLEELTGLDLDDWRGSPGGSDREDSNSTPQERHHFGEHVS